MPKLDGTGPDGKGSQTGRKLGKCSELSDTEKLQKLGKGMGLRRKSESTKEPGSGKGERLKSGEK
jgi:hypothetical protein